MSPMRMSGVGLALVISLAIDQIFCFAPSMRPDIEPVVSSTKQTSILGLACFSDGGSFASALCVTSNVQVNVSSVVIAWFPLTLTLSLGDRGKPAMPARNSGVALSGAAVLLAATESMWTTEGGCIIRAL